MTHHSPLLDLGDAPRFDLITPDQVEPVIDRLIADAEAALREVAQVADTIDHAGLSARFDPPLQRLWQAWGLVGHLLAVADTRALRAAHAACLPKVMALSTRIDTDPRLFAMFRRLVDDPSIGDDERVALRKRVTALELSGAALSGPARERHAANVQRSAALSQAFSQHLLDATDAHVEWVSAPQLRGLPEERVRALRDAAARDGRPPHDHKLTLHAPVYAPVMQQVHDRALRERLYLAHATRASEAGPPERDNAPVMREILALRQQRAALLGHRSHADVSLVQKMAASPEEVQAFLEDLLRRTRPAAAHEARALRDFARERLGIDALQAWDVAYASERLREQRHAYGVEEVRAYFPFERVLQGVFAQALRLFDVAFDEDPQPAWHPEVRCLRVRRGDEVLGRLYLDPHARPGKREGTWMSGARPRWRRSDGSLRLAMAYLVTNSAAPADGRPALLTHAEVVTLFHEFGHALHFLLSRVEVLGVSGISGVEWDAVELPSQLMENLCWRHDVLQSLSAHVDTGETLPRALFERLSAARNFQVGLSTLRQLELALLDLRLHADASRAERVRATALELQDEVAVLPRPPQARLENAFGHIFAGAYAAGYYSYLWAEVMSADAWRCFESDGGPDAATGRRYRAAVLERGGSRPMLQNFIDFVGRAPDPQALLAARGLA